MKEQIKEAVSRRLLPRKRARMRSDTEWGWAQVRSAVQGASAEEKTKIIHALIDTELMKRHLKALADTEADDKLADDSLNLEELKEIL